MRAAWTPSCNTAWWPGIQAMRDSGLQVTEANTQRVGIMMGSGMGGLESIEEAYDKIYGDARSEKGIAVLHPRQHHQSGQRTFVDHVQDHRTQSRGRHRVHHLDACDRPCHALDPVGRCGCDAGGRFGDGHLPHRHERLCPGQSVIAAQRRSAGCQPALGQGSRRLRHGRRCRRHAARGIRITPRREAREFMPRWSDSA